MPFFDIVDERMDGLTVSIYCWGERKNFEATFGRSEFYRARSRPGGGVDLGGESWLRGASWPENSLVGYVADTDVAAPTILKPVGVLKLVG